MSVIENIGGLDATNVHETGGNCSQIYIPKQIIQRLVISSSFQDATLHGYCAFGNTILVAIHVHVLI